MALGDRCWAVMLALTMGWLIVPVAPVQGQEQEGPPIIIPPRIIAPPPPTQPPPPPPTFTLPPPPGLPNGPPIVTPVDQNQLGSSFAFSTASSALSVPPFQDVQEVNDSALAQLLPGLPDGDNHATQLVSARLDTDGDGDRDDETDRVLSYPELSSIIVEAAIHADQVVITFPTSDLPPGSDPQLMFLDKSTNTYKPVKGSSEIPNSLVIGDGFIKVILDKSSFPPINALLGHHKINPERLIASSRRAQRFAGDDMIAFATDASAAFGSSYDTLFQVSGTASDLVAFNNKAQLFRNDQIKIFGADGTFISRDKERYTLPIGRATLETRGQKASVATASGTIAVEPLSELCLEANPQKAHSLVSYVRGSQPAVVNMQAGSFVTLQPGHNIVLSTLSGKTLPFRIVHEKNGRIVETTPNNATCVVMGSDLSGSKCVNKGMVTKARDANPMHMICADGTVFGVKDRQLHLRSGSLFLEATDAMDVRVGPSKVRLAKNALVSISRPDPDGAIRVNCFSDPNSVMVSCEGKKYNLNPGQELVLIDHKPTRQEMLPKDGIGRRQFQLEDLPDGSYTAARCDFNIVMALRNTYLSRLANPNSTSDKLLQGRILKTACAVAMSTSGHGKYFSR